MPQVTITGNVPGNNDVMSQVTMTGNASSLCNTPMIRESDEYIIK